mmetsp:Transcript_54955/g.91340  ORF Transcript_54955/g.91340 Transcript_54955/m.91340 type:complete len:243 (-) Transcript_54955:1594-2322(-)
MQLHQRRGRETQRLQARIPKGHDTQKAAPRSAKPPDKSQPTILTIPLRNRSEKPWYFRRQTYLTFLVLLFCIAWRYSDTTMQLDAIASLRNLDAIATLRQFPGFRDFMLNSTEFDINTFFDLFDSPVSSENGTLRAGEILRDEGLRGVHPVVIIPGITSTGLELWEGKPCAKSYFRQRIWGTFTMLRNIVSDRVCWMHHLSLDSSSGLDLEGVRVRAATGLEAADFFLANVSRFTLYDRLGR